MPTIQFRTDESTKDHSAAIFGQFGMTMSEMTIPRYNPTTLAALSDMEQSKNKGIRGKNVRSVLDELKRDE